MQKKIIKVEPIVNPVTGEMIDYTTAPTKAVSAAMLVLDSKIKEYKKMFEAAKKYVKQSDPDTTKFGDWTIDTRYRPGDIDPDRLPADARAAYLEAATTIEMITKAHPNSRVLKAYQVWRRPIF